MIRRRGNAQEQGLMHRSGSRHARGAVLCVAALIAVFPHLAAPAGSPLDFTSSAYARDGGSADREDADRQMRQQAEDDRKRQAEDQKRQADDAARAAKDAADAAARSARDQQSTDNSRSSHESNASNDDGGSSRQHQSSGQSGGESTSSNSRGNSGDDGDSRGRGGDQTANSRNDSGHGDSGKGDSSKPDSSKGDGKDDNSGNTRASNHDDHDDRPPATVEQWLKQLTSPKPSHDQESEHSSTSRSAQGNTWTTETKPSTSKDGSAKANKDQSEKSKPGAAKTEATKTATGKAQNGKPQTGKQQSAKASAGGTPPPITLPDLATPDVLAVNASAQTIQRAKALGFKTRPAAKFSNINIAITALIPPDGMNPIEAQELLNREMPQSSFEYNKKYRIYRTASGTEGPQPGTRAATLHAPGTASDCSGDHCFGRDVIGWKPEMRSCVNGVRIGIIDTSVDVTHPAFTNKKLEVHHFGSDGAPAGPDWHGTGVTALLAGDASSGTPGMIPDANFFVADIFHADSDHEPASDTLSMLRAFDWLDAKGVKVVNMSLSGPADDLIHKAIEKLAAKGVLFVAAAGNEGPNAGPSYPAAYEQVIAVTAVNKDLQSYRYANRGTYIDVAAPGVAIWTALPGSKEGYHSGTSFATPYVTATLAAIYPKLTVKTQAEALQMIQYKDLGAPGRDPIYGQGLLVAPTSCSAGQMAAAPQSGASPASASSTTGTSAMRATSNPAEPLPWLTLQSQ